MKRAVNVGEVKKVFGQMNTNSSGRITREEFMNWERRTRVNIAAWFYDQVWSKIYQTSATYCNQNANMESSVSNLFEELHGPHQERYIYITVQYMLIKIDE